MKDEIHFVLNESGEVYSTFDSRYPAEHYAAEYGAGYTVATYVRAGRQQDRLRAAEARIAELEQDRYHVWMRGFQAKVLGAAPSSNPFPEPPITVGPLPLPVAPANRAPHAHLGAGKGVVEWGDELERANGRAPGVLTETHFGKAPPLVAIAGYPGVRAAFCEACSNYPCTCAAPRPVPISDPGPSRYDVDPSELPG